jgi:NAD(P)-dependent dehydrogenase (short-subunit alcohol dehydrogenase family)
MPGLVEGRVCIVTGAGRGIGREHALMLAAHGAKVVVNDLGGAADGEGADASPAQQVVDEIVGMGGEAVVNADDVSDFAAAERMVRQAVEAFGRLDVLVNNAGILRDRMLVNMTEAEWDAVVKVHLKGTFAPSRHAAAYWRDLVKAGETVDARIVNTTSVSGIYGNPGQTNYGAAKSGIASFTIIAARELGRYGITVNAVAPSALTRLTAPLMAGRLSEEEMETQSPRWVAPIVTWLASTESRGVTGRVFEATPNLLGVAETWRRGPTVDPVDDPTKLGPVVADLLGRAQPNTRMDGSPEPAAAAGQQARPERAAASGQHARPEAQ